MKQLSGLDAGFLVMESTSVYGHVGSVCVLDPSTAPEPLTLANLTDMIASRLHMIPVFRRRLVDVPFGLDQPYWIEDPDFDIEYHVRELALPEPGDDHQLAEQTTRLHARPLDRRRPLWELYLIHGLAEGRKAIYTKVHHAAIDGVAGNELLEALLDYAPEGREIEFVPWDSEQEPRAVEMLARSAVTLTLQPLRAARLSYGLARSLPRLATSPARPRLPVIDRLIGRDANVVLSAPNLRAPGTPFNKKITPHRRWGFRSVPLDDVKRVKSAHGTTVNDVVMALCAGALRRWLTKHDALPSDPLIAAVPVSIRTEAEKGTYGNRVSMMMAPLPTHLEDPVERLLACSQAMRSAKDQHGALPADLLTNLPNFAMPALAGQAVRAAERLRLMERVNPFNVVISNVPGPNRPLYYAGARLLAYYPMSAIADGQGLNMTVQSFDGHMHFGLLACRELVPDVDDMAGYLVDELQTLVAPLDEDGRSQAQADTAKAEDGTAKAQSETAKAQGDTTKAEGGTAKAQGGTAPAQGGTTKAQGETAKAQGGTAKAAPRKKAGQQ